MIIHHSDFDKMFKYLEGDLPIPLSEAIDKWIHIEDTGMSTMEEWLKVLVDKTKDCMDEGYSVGTAMINTWVNSYGAIKEDSDRWYLYIRPKRFFLQWIPG